jgi:fructose-1,6-bisphosphatase I
LKATPLIVTVQQHLLQGQKRFLDASGEFLWLLSGVTLATKMVQAHVRRAGLTDMLGAAGEAGEVHVQGEVQQKLDMHAHDALMHCQSVQTSVGVLAFQPFVPLEDS